MKLSWNDVDEKTLIHLYYEENLSDNAIANMYGIDKNRVGYKRRKYNIFYKRKIYKGILERQDGQLNTYYKDNLLNKDNISTISKAITHFAFRNGPVEDMHANNQLSENDMKTLNKYMVNRIAGLLTAIVDDNKWTQMAYLLDSHYKHFGKEWDEVVPDMAEFDVVLEEILNSIFDNMNKKFKIL